MVPGTPTPIVDLCNNDKFIRYRSPSWQNPATTTGRTKYSLWDDDDETDTSTSSSSNNESETSNYMCSDGEDGNEREYPHPLGFRDVVNLVHNRIGLTRFTLLEEDSDDDQFYEPNRQRIVHRPLPEQLQVRTSILPNTGLSRHTVGTDPTSIVLHHILSQNRSAAAAVVENYNTALAGMERIAAMMMSAATFASSEYPQQVSYSSNFVPSKLASLDELVEAARRVELKMEKERKRVRREHMVRFAPGPQSARYSFQISCIVSRSNIVCVTIFVPSEPNSPFSIAFSILHSTLRLADCLMTCNCRKQRKRCVHSLYKMSETHSISVNR